MLDAVKKACRVTAAAYDDELTDLIAAAKADLTLAGVAQERADDETDPLIRRAVKTFCRMNFGAPENYEKLKASYDEQKAQLQGASGYTMTSEETAEYIAALFESMGGTSDGES